MYVCMYVCICIHSIYVHRERARELNPRKHAMRGDTYAFVALYVHIYYVYIESDTCTERARANMRCGAIPALLKHVPVQVFYAFLFDKLKHWREARCLSAFQTTRATRRRRARERRGGGIQLDLEILV